MSSISTKWSVASVFNPFGMHRFEEINPTNYTVSSQDPSCSIYNLDTTIERVVDCIRSLGYSVNFGMCRETTRLVIQSIQCLKTKRFVYGTASCPYLSSEKTYIGWRNLAGNRTIYEKAKKFYPERFAGEYDNFISDVSKIFTQTKIFELIDNGEVKKQFTDELNLYLKGVSTIGNTLPSDIVEALRDFTSDDPNFVNEPWYEFYIPMTEMACPVAEESANCPDGDSAACVPAAAAACKKKSDTDSSCSSSDSDDDDC